MEPRKNAASAAVTAASAKRMYTRPMLTTFGKVAALTRQTGCTANNDGNSACTPGATNMSMLGSDRNVKENIVRIGLHPLDIGLYLFDYKAEFRAAWGTRRQFGVMADEVEAVMPAAVSRHPDGYKMVDYSMLGITLFKQ